MSQITTPIHSFHVYSLVCEFHDGNIDNGDEAGMSKITNGNNNIVIRRSIPNKPPPFGSKSAET